MSNSQQQYARMSERARRDPKRPYTTADVKIILDTLGVPPLPRFDGDGDPLHDRYYDALGALSLMLGIGIAMADLRSYANNMGYNDDSNSIPR